MNRSVRIRDVASCFLFEPFLPLETFQRGAFRNEIRYKNAVDYYFKTFN